MPEIRFDPLEIVKRLEDLKYKKFTRARNRKCIDRIVTTYKKFSGGEFPIGIQKLDVDRDELHVPDIEEKAEEFIEFENELYGKQRELKKLTKRKRKNIVSNQELFDEFQAKSNKVAKIKHEANIWTEEDITEDTSVSTTCKKIKIAKKIDTKILNKKVDNSTKITDQPNSWSRSSDKKVKSTSKLAQSKTSTPNIFVDKSALSSSEKHVKIALKMNRSQEVTEYIRQLKQSPHPYDSAKKPSKGVLKPNLAPSPINPFYKKLIGIE